MTSVVMAPDERAVREHLRGGRFLAGFASGHWRLVSATWPFVLVTLSAAERPNSPTEFALRFELTGYPHAAPTGGLWDLLTGGRQRAHSGLAALIQVIVQIARDAA